MPRDRRATDGLLSWIDHLDDRGVFITDRDMVLRTWNRWLAVHSGLSASEAVGRSLYELYPELKRRGFDAYYAAALAGEPRLLSERFHRYLLPLRRSVAGADGFEMAQSVRIEPLLLDNAIGGAITVITDVTDRVITERELRSRITAAEHAREVAEHASHLKDEFLATLSHEIRTPLNAVIGWARLLLRRSTDPAQHSALTAIERNSLKQLQLVDDLLGMSRVISGRLRLSPGAVDIAALVEETLEPIRAGAEAKGLRVETAIDAGIPVIKADTGRLKQALWHLASNAVKFTPSGGSVQITVARDRDRIVIRIRDEGIGIAAEFLPFVFEMFRQADATPARLHGGLGLGLALTRRIVELHGGDIGVESAGTDRGATFWLALPIVSPTTMASAAPAPIPPVIALPGVNVLVVHPDDDARSLIVALLGDFGATVRAVDSEQATIDLLRGPLPEPDVLVVDVESGAIDGVTLLRTLRTIRNGRPIPAIAIGADSGTNDRIRALAAGFAHYLVAPVDPGLLAATIGAAARDRRDREPEADLPSVMSSGG